MMRSLAAAVVALACAGPSLAGEVAINLEGGWAELEDENGARAVFWQAGDGLLDALGD